MAFSVDIITPDGPLFSGEATSVIVPGSAGSFEVLERHAPIISSLDSGTVKADTTDGQKTYDIQSGVIEVSAEGAVSVLIEKLAS